MTFFSVVLIIFILSCFLTSVAKKTKITQYQKKQKSQAKLQYDEACDAIKKLGVRYRQIAATLSIEDYLGDKSIDEIIISTKNIHDFNGELAWLKVTAIACGIYNNDNNYVKYIYNNNIWDIIPDSIDKIDSSFITYWTNSYKNNLDSNKLIYYLKESVRIKNIILNNKDGNSYTAYRNEKIINILAEENNLPSIKECCYYGYTPHTNINIMAQNIALKKMNRLGYGWAMIDEICVSPTATQKQQQYKSVTNAEYQNKLTKERLEKYSIYK